MGLHGVLLSVSSLEEEQIQTMYTLMDQHYNNVFHAQFEKDLFEKDWVILLLDDLSEEIKGFSTQTLFKHFFKTESILILFSGDTIIHPKCWGTFALPIAWGRMMLYILSRNPENKLYWMLTSKGIRTYRYLPVFFNEFYPRYNLPTPIWEQQLLNSLGKRKYRDHYDKTAGIVRATDNSQFLKTNLAVIEEARRQKDPHIAFFLRQNPYFQRGDELVCIAPFHEANIKPNILRKLKKEKLSRI
jgi:hypothetical protein